MDNSEKKTRTEIEIEIIKRFQELKKMYENTCANISDIQNPYEIAIERKELGRVIECLAREDIGVYKCRKGVYYEAKGMEL